MAKKSKMRIYKDHDYSDHEVYLDMTVNLNDTTSLWIDTPKENIRLEADDVIVTLWPHITELIEAELQDED